MVQKNVSSFTSFANSLYLPTSSGTENTVFIFDFIYFSITANIIMPCRRIIQQTPICKSKTCFAFCKEMSAFWPIPFLRIPITKNRQLQKKILKFASPRNDNVTVERKDCRKEAIFYAPCIELRQTLNFTNRPEGRKFPRKGEETWLMQLHLPQE